MAQHTKESETGKVQDQGNQRYKVQKGSKADELDAEVQLLGKGTYRVERLKMDKLPANMPDRNAIRWFTNFGVKKDEAYITEKYNVTLTGLAEKLGKSKLVIFDGKKDPYYYQGKITNGDTIELSDGDPAIGGAP